MPLGYKIPVAFLVLVVALGVCNSVSKADLIEIGTTVSTSGKVPESLDSVSATANFYYNTSNKDRLIIDLVNTTTGGTLAPADALVGLVFNMSGSPTYASTPSSANLTPGLTLTGNGTTSTSIGTGSFSNSWTNDYQGGNPKVSGGYGISTNGFSGAFKGQGLGSENNGIVAKGTTLTNGFNSGAHQPLALNGLELVLTFNSDISVSTLRNVQFLFGTSGTGVLNGTAVLSTPEPSTFAIAGLGTLGFLAYGARRRRQAA